MLPLGKVTEENHAEFLRHWGTKVCIPFTLYDEL